MCVYILYIIYKIYFIYNICVYILYGGLCVYIHKRIQIMPVIMSALVYVKA